jgi:chorismate synthase
MINPIRLLTAGESHGPKLTGLLEGIPAGFKIDREKINIDLSRRQQGFGRGGRMKIEHDQARITSGLIDKLTTGGPIACEITNIDFKNWKEKNIVPMTAPRPGHADYAGTLKYAHDDLRLTLERASARETAMRTALGSICKQVLEHFNIKILAYVISIGKINSSSPLSCNNKDYLARYQQALGNQFAFMDESKIDHLEDEIRAAMKAKDTLGGIFETVALNVPPGLGSCAHFDRRLDAALAHAMISIQAMKAVEIGDGIINANKRGTQVHDEFNLNNDRSIDRSTNRAGGLEGGMSNGMPIVVRTFMKPISTTLNPRKSIDLAKGVSASTVYERSDFCAVQRAVPVAEAMMSYVLLNELVKKIGGDNVHEMQNNFANLKMGALDNFSLKDQQWRFNYENE